MKKKGAIGGAIVAVIVVAAVAYGLGGSDDPVNLYMERMHGSVSTAAGSPVFGNPEAKVTIVEFGDYQCHQCLNWFKNTRPTIVEQYIETGQANLIFVDMPFLGRDSPAASQASYCAEDQGKYWEYHDGLYLSQRHTIDGWIDRELLRSIAVNLGLDMELFDSCIDSKKYQKRVQTNFSESRSFGVAATPTFLIVSEGKEERVRGAQPYHVFKKILDSMT